MDWGLASFVLLVGIVVVFLGNSFLKTIQREVIAEQIMKLTIRRALLESDPDRLDRLGSYLVENPKPLRRIEQMVDEVKKELEAEKNGTNS
jgi:hypothetical protein